MTKKEYIQQLASVKINMEKVSKVANIYGKDLPEAVQEIVSASEESIFFDDNSRILAFDEILDAEQDLHVDFKAKGMIPLADCGENDFIVYNIGEKNWSKFNIVDEVSFKKKESLEELLL